MFINTMRYEGYFDAARAALLAATGEDLTAGERLHDARSVYDELLSACEAALACIAAEPGSEFEATTGRTAFDPAHQEAVDLASAAIANAHTARENEI